MKQDREPLSRYRRISPTFAGFVALAAPLVTATTDLFAAEWRGYAALTTDYVFRGVTFSDGRPAVQVGAEVALDNGLFLGAWASSVDIETAAGTERDAEVDYYLGYSFEVDARWTLAATAVAYTFPGAEGGFDYNYEEYAVSLNYDDRLWLEYGYTPRIFATAESAHNFGLHAEHSLTTEWTISGGVGYYDLDDLAEAGYTYWEAGLSRAVSDRLILDLRYHEASGSVRFISTPDRIDPRIALSLRLNF